MHGAGTRVSLEMARRVSTAALEVELEEELELQVKLQEGARKVGGAGGIGAGRWCGKVARQGGTLPNNKR